jgi:putative phosphoesterase
MRARATPRHAAPPRVDRRRLRLDGGGVVRIAVVADTHSAPDARAIEAISDMRPALVLHAGDVGDPTVLDRLGAIAPLVAVRGNIDAKRADLPDVVVLDIERDDAPTARLLLVHVAVAGPRLRAEVRALATAERADLVVCGHSHVPFLGRDRGIAVFNPGSIGPRRFALPIVYGVIELGPGAIEARHVDAETGRAWCPAPSSR